MINHNMEAAFNKQINAEFYSAYMYLSMCAHFEDMNLLGFANWMKVQTQEEVAHAMGIFDYLHSRGGKAILEQIDKPPHHWDSPLHIFEEALKHEQHVTSLIWNLADIAESEKDRASMTFLKWYIDEQVEEEDTAGNLVAKLKLIGSDANALLQLDKDLAARTFTPPVIG